MNSSSEGAWTACVLGGARGCQTAATCRFCHVATFFLASFHDSRTLRVAREVPPQAGAGFESAGHDPIRWSTRIGACESPVLSPGESWPLARIIALFCALSL